MPSAATHLGPRRRLVVHDRLPRARGEVSAAVLDRLIGGARGAGRPTPDRSMAVEDDDAQLAFWLLNVVRVADFDGIDGGTVDWAPWPLETALADRFEHELRALVPDGPERVPGDLVTFLDELRGRPAAGRATGGTTRDLELAAFTSKAPYLGWEADPHCLLLAVIEPELKQAVAAIQAGEYGVGHDQTHATIYRECLSSVGLSITDAVDRASGPDLALANSAWLFARRRHLRGASLGQLCFMEMDSVGPARERASAWDRTGLPANGRRWYDVHVLADAEHDHIVRHDLLPVMEERTPWLVPDAAFGAWITWCLQSWPR